MRCLSGAALVAVVLSLTACTSSEPEREAASAEEVRIGVLVPRSGASRAAGIEAQHGAELAVALVNGEEGPVALAGAGTEGLAGLGGAKLAIVAGDTHSDPEDGAAEAARLVSEERVVGLVGAYDSVVTEAASQRTERLRVPFLNGDSPAGHLSERGLDWFFRTGPTDRMLGEAFFSALREIAGGGVDRVAAVYADDRPSNVVVDLTEDLATEGGFELVAKPSFEPGTSPVGAVAELRDLPDQPDAVFAIASTPKDASALLKAFGEARYSPPGILAFGPGFLPSTLRNAGADGEGLLTGTAWSREIAGRNTISKTVMDLYEERFSQPMGDIAAGTFTAVLVLAQAIDNAGSTDPQRVRAALLNLDIPGREMVMPWSGVRFDDASHQNVAANGVIEQRVQDTFRVVFPGELQRAEPVWPRPAPGAAT